MWGKWIFWLKKIVTLQTDQKIAWWNELYLHHLPIFNDEPDMDSQKDLESC